jgi:hypothetical protein
MNIAAAALITELPVDHNQLQGNISIVKDRTEYVISYGIHLPKIKPTESSPMALYKLVYSFRFLDSPEEELLSADKWGFRPGVIAESSPAPTISGIKRDERRFRRGCKRALSDAVGQMCAASSLRSAGTEAQKMHYQHSVGFSFDLPEGWHGRHTFPPPIMFFGPMPNGVLERVLELTVAAIFPQYIDTWQLKCRPRELTSLMMTSIDEYFRLDQKNAELEVPMTRVVALNRAIMGDTLKQAWKRARQLIGDLAHLIPELGQNHDPESIKYVVGALGDAAQSYEATGLAEAVALREAAHATLIKIGPDAIARLTEGLAEQDRDVRYHGHLAILSRVQRYVP